MTTSRITSGDELKYRNGLAGLRGRGMPLPYPVRARSPAGAFGLTVPTRQTLDMNRLADRHVRHGWVRTIHSSQGATCDHVIAHLESFRANTVDAASAYVAISRARKGPAIYTDSRARLTEALGLRDGAQVGAVDLPERRDVGQDSRTTQMLHANAVSTATFGF
jgi:hypothetical protein